MLGERINVIVSYGRKIIAFSKYQKIISPILFRSVLADPTEGAVVDSLITNFRIKKTEEVV